MDNLLLENVFKLGIAILVGGIIGAEREYRDKAAGFRTIILITVGSTLFTIFSLTLDPGFSRSRIAANIVTGIGFLGAGAIVREHGRIGGMTTAAAIWLSAALGMGVGGGEMIFVLITTAVVLMVLLLFPRVEGWINNFRETRNYKILMSTDDLNRLDTIQEALEKYQLHVYEHHQSKNGDMIHSTWNTIGKPANHERFIRAMMKDKRVKELMY
jgi:putative Mg2+ transporter-C (MgtC) family protein